MIIDDVYVFNQDGDDSFNMTVTDRPELFGTIKKDFSENKTKSVFSIKYFWNKVLQDELFADDVEEAKGKLKDVLSKADKQIKYIQTYENFKDKK